MFDSLRYCPAGWPLSLPPCHAPPNDGLVFSVVVAWLVADGVIGHHDNNQIAWTGGFSVFLLSELMCGPA